MKRLLLLAFIFIALPSFPRPVSACPGCKEAAFDTPAEAEQKQAAARGYAASIGLLLTVPVVLLGVVGWGLVRSARRHIPPSSAAEHSV